MQQWAESLEWNHPIALWLNHKLHKREFRGRQNKLYLKHYVRQTLREALVYFLGVLVDLQQRMQFIELKQRLEEIGLEYIPSI